MKQYSWIIIAVLLVALIAGASSLYDRLGSAYEMEQLATNQSPVAAETTAAKETNSGETETPAKTAPDFSVVDADGNEVKLSDFFGKPIVLNFWASWCGPCKSEMPDFDEAYRELGEDIQFLMVNMTDGDRETVEVAKAFIADAGYSFPVYYDVNFDAAITYGVSSLPTTYFIDGQGNLVAYGKGAMSAETLQKGIDMIMP